MTKDQQIKHLKAIIGGLVRSLYYTQEREYGERRKKLEVQRSLDKLVARVGSGLLEKEREELRAMAYRNGIIFESLPHWATKQ